MFALEGLAECELISQDLKTPFIAVIIYANILYSYVFVSEELLGRWIRRRDLRQRTGKFLVALWLSVIMVFILCQFFSEGRVQTPENLILTFELVLGGYLGPEISKLLFLTKYPIYKKIYEQHKIEGKKKRRLKKT
jgi:hypothetical protein